MMMMLCLQFFLKDFWGDNLILRACYFLLAKVVVHSPVKSIWSVILFAHLDGATASYR